MAKKNFKLSKTDNPLLIEAMGHYTQWTEDNDTRMTRKNGWNDVTDAYWGKLPSDWPYISRVVDPRIRTSVHEKNARLLNSKLRGRLVPREGGDVLGARINNALLDFQWENANHGGTMLEKWAISDVDTRLYASKFALVTWRHEVDTDGKTVLFSGNEFEPLDIRDCGMDPTASHIRSAKWFQYRKWEKLDDLERVSEVDGTYIYPGLAELKMRMAEGRQDRRDNAYSDRVLQLKGLEDRIGQDKSFPVVEVVRELRKDKWIVFAPRYKVLLAVMNNPYAHKKIPVVQNRYFPIQGDPLGESEVEPVLPIWRAIQATVCGYLDNMNMHMRPPLKVINGRARIETIVYGPEAQWDVDSIDAVTELQSSGNPMQYFQTTYSALVSAFNTAMGDMSQGNSGADPFNPEKTATEIRQSAKQQNTRDQKNQTSLAETIQDMMSMWMSNNKQFLFDDPSKKEYIIRIVGSELFNYFQRAGLDEEEVSEDAMNMIGEIINAEGGNVSDDDMMALLEAGKQPRFPVIDNPEEKDPMKLQIKPKMRVNDMKDGAELSVTPEDINGTYDYIADVRSMSTGADAELQQARQNAITLITSNPTVLQLLQQENVRPQIKELLVSSLEDLGLKDAERFFATQEQIPTGTTTGGGLQQNQQVGGIPPELEAVIGAGNNPAMAQSQGLPQSGQIPGGIQPPTSQGAGIPGIA